VNNSVFQHSSRQRVGTQNYIAKGDIG